jgi:S-adenosylmethionine:tRNA ribosyltransferase-isomerase
MIVITTMQNNDNHPDRLLASYDFELASELIADRPIEGRQNSKLLVFHAKSNRIEHMHYFDLPNILSKDHLLVLNKSKVFPCRLIGEKSTGGKCEVFVLSLIDNNGIYPAMIKTRGKKNIGDCFKFGELVVEIKNIEVDGSFQIKFNQNKEELLNTLETIGNIPIPPYIRGGVADERDLEDYQTVYAKNTGSVAAPTAGLHFTEEIFSNLEKNGIKKSFLTLHVGAGTFKPVTTESILEHKMHSEYFNIETEDLAQIRNYQKKLIAVGTTSLRVLETLSNKEGYIRSPNAELDSTDIFLYPGKEVHSIEGLITNFHLPKSTLLMLVSTIIGREKALELYKVAVENKYRFFSYGDGMIILRDS